MMKLSNETVSLLNNYSTINSNLVVKEGNLISTISEQKNIMAKAEVTENFDSEFGLYDLPQFLGALSLVEDPDLNFSDESVTIKGTGSSVNYRFSSPEILTYPTKEINMPDADVEFTLTEDVINKVRKAAATLGHTVFSVKGNGGKLSCEVTDPTNATANTFNLSVGECDDDVTCDCQFLISNLKLVPGEYNVKISKNLISEWINVKAKVTYWIALEKNSTFA